MMEKDYISTIVDLCGRDYNMEKEHVISNLQQCIEFYIVRKVENKYKKSPYHINQEAVNKSNANKAVVQTETEDSLTFMDKIYEEIKYEVLKEKLILRKKARFYGQNYGIRYVQI